MKVQRVTKNVYVIVCNRQELRTCAEALEDAIKDSQADRIYECMGKVVYDGKKSAEVI